MQISRTYPFGVKVFLHKPMSSKEGLSTTHCYDFLDSCADDNGKISFLFKNRIQEHGIGYLHPTNNMKYISVCPEKDSYEEDWIFYEHHGDDCWSRIQNDTIMPWIKSI